MHQCLKIPEIVQIIADFLLGGTTQENSPSANLYALSLTCHSFYDPAIISLWSEIRTNLPLAHLFPEDLFRVKGHHPAGFYSNAMIPLRQITPADWTRFDFYAQHVRTFVTGDQLTIMSEKSNLPDYE
ncbi:hypothetical protein C8Q75DRAFT_754207 [Abortiporus biennis]|nr:hypothetical protein C8Q75DRAFT_754207 [Abortiporus biennis]